MVVQQYLEVPILPFVGDLRAELLPDEPFFFFVDRCSPDGFQLRRNRVDVFRVDLHGLASFDVLKVAHEVVSWQNYVDRRAVVQRNCRVALIIPLNQVRASGEVWVGVVSQ